MKCFKIHPLILVPTDSVLGFSLFSLRWLQVICVACLPVANHLIMASAFFLHFCLLSLPGWRFQTISLVLSFFFFFFVFLGPYARHMKVPRLGVWSELQPLAYTTAVPDLSHICSLDHSSWQHWILNPLSEARDWTRILMHPSQIHFCWAMTGIPVSLVLVQWLLVYSGAAPASLPVLLSSCSFLSPVLESLQIVSECLEETLHLPSLTWQTYMILQSPARKTPSPWCLPWPYPRQDCSLLMGHCSPSLCLKS